MHGRSEAGGRWSRSAARGGDDGASRKCEELVSRADGVVGDEILAYQAGAGGDLLELLPPLPRIDLATRIRYNPRLETAIFMVPGISAVLLILITMIVTAMGFTREREVGTLEQVLVTPLSPTVVILGKLIPFAVIGLFDFLLALTVGSWLFDVPIRGSLLFLFGVTALYLLTTLSSGLLISTVSTSQQQALLPVS